MTKPALREITLTAYTCRINATDVYLGLAAGLDDILAHNADANQLMALPLRRIAIANGHTTEVPLRVLAVRDSSIVNVLPVDGPAPEGFKRVQLRFTVGAIRKNGNGHASDEFHAPGRVMAFVLTFGLSPDQEDHFFQKLFNDLLRDSWISLPKLLHDIGCDSSHLSEGQPVESGS